jgi:hypothetical protein
MRRFCTSGQRRAVALAVLVSAFVALGASAASGAPPSPHPHPTHPPFITPGFALTPDHGPVGTQVTVQGICGSFRPEILYAVGVEDATGFHTIWLPPNFATVNPAPFGSFQFTFTFPFAGNVGTTDPIGPGTYFVGVACNGPPQTIFLGSQPFTVIPSD